jgi:hypothetical protein
VKHAIFALSLCATPLGCQPRLASNAQAAPAASTAAPSSPLPATNAAAGPTPTSAEARRLAASAACNRVDNAAVFLARSPEASQTLRRALDAGPVAVRYAGCKVEVLPSCRVNGQGKLAASRSCCSSDAGCSGDGVDCYGDQERYWFSDELEWLLNLPETLDAWSTREPAALRVGATVREEYRLARDFSVEESCADATHVITRARFGALSIEAEGPRRGQGPPDHWTLSAAASADTLIDVTLAPVGERATRRVCMGLTKYRQAFVPPPFLGEVYRSTPLRCDSTCDDGSCSCATRRGGRCGGAAAASDAELRTVCDVGGDRSAVACSELSMRLQGDVGLEYAWLACERGRQGCDRTAELLAARKAKDDTRFERALRYGCASGNVELCCAWGSEKLDHEPALPAAADILRDLCAEGRQRCCTALQTHGRAIPPRRRQPD